jgi:LytS/YehU family sensor histidine kinase
VELPFAIAGTLLYAALTVAAARTVTQSAATLFEVGTLHATRAAEYRNAAATARFDALQARMNPHVLFNALNTVASLVRSDPPAAERIVHTLGDVLKQTLDRSSDVNGTVAQEIAYVETCLALEKERWGDHLRVSWSIEDEVRDWRMPPFTIQPLVENALRHGLGAHIEGGHIAISIRRHGDALVASVTDDGAGFPQRWREGNGIGALRQRLAALYGDNASIAIERAAGRGASVVVRLPKEIARLPLVTTGADGARVDR